MLQCPKCEKRVRVKDEDLWCDSCNEFKEYVLVVEDPEEE